MRDVEPNAAATRRRSPRSFHISYLLFLISHLFCFLPLDPALFVHLPAARDGQRSGGDILDDRRSGADVRALADAHRRDQLRVAADERAVLDDGLMLLLAIVIARDRAGDDVDPLATRRVAEIREMVRLRPLAERRLFQLDEVADVRP